MFPNTAIYIVTVFKLFFFPPHSCYTTTAVASTTSRRNIRHIISIS